MKKIIIFLTISVVIGLAQESDVAVISTKFGDIVLEFYPQTAPKHVESFKILAQEGYFNGTTFHRIVPGFVIQGGDSNSKDDDRSNDGLGGRAGKFYGIWDHKQAQLLSEAKANPDSWLVPAEFNERPHVRGALSMARIKDPNSASSQFFICTDDVNRLDRIYTVFGQVIQGLEVVDIIVGVKRDAKDNPLEKVEMNISIIPRASVSP